MQASRGVLSVIAIACAVATPFAAASGITPGYATAARQHQEGRWSGAYGRFIAPGLGSDPAAASAALFMHAHGFVLYRTHWDLSSDEAEDLRAVKQMML